MTNQIHYYILLGLTAAFAVTYQVQKNSFFLYGAFVLLALALVRKWVDKKIKNSP